MDYTWQYYDRVLFGIVASMFLGELVGYATGVSLLVAVVAASLVAIAIITHGLFVNGPVDGPEDLAEEVEALN
jgi:hypothetical protein